MRGISKHAGLRLKGRHPRWPLSCGQAREPTSTLGQQDGGWWWCESVSPWFSTCVASILTLSSCFLLAVLRHMAWVPPDTGLRSQPNEWNRGACPLRRLAPAGSCSIFHASLSTLQEKASCCPTMVSPPPLAHTGVAHGCSISPFLSCGGVRAEKEQAPRVFAAVMAGGRVDTLSLAGQGGGALPRLSSSTVCSQALRV